MVLNVAILGGIPAIAMLSLTFIGLGIDVSHNIAGALQHFAAGILLCSIATELVPPMKDAEGFLEVFASAVGFFSGVFLMILVGVLFPEIEEDDDEEDVDLPVLPLQSPFGGGPRQTSVSGRKSSLIAEAYKFQESSATPRKIEIPSEYSPLNSGTGSVKTRAFPAAMLLTVSVDSILDGLLIGIATAAGPSAGPMLALSLCVEMSFLGLTLATAMAGQPKKKSIPAAFLGPVCIIAGALCGGILSSTLQHNPLMMIALLSFGVAALLFMVAEELLLEAHEEGDHVWWVDLQLYIGFFVSILLCKLVPE